MSRVGGSLLGSGALAVLALCSLVFTTGMTPSNVVATTPTVSAPALDPAEWVPDSKRMLWIKDVVDEPVQFRSNGGSVLDALIPGAGAAQATTV